VQELGLNPWFHRKNIERHTALALGLNPVTLEAWHLCVEMGSEKKARKFANDRSIRTAYVSMSLDAQELAMVAQVLNASHE
jgi:hypothetical protein